MDAILNMFGLELPPDGFEVFLYIVKSAFGIVILNEMFKLIKALLTSFTSFK